MEVLYSLLGAQSMAKVVRHSRLRWFGHVECKNGDDWVSACRNVVVAGVRCVGRGRKTSVAYLGFHKGGPNFCWPLVPIHLYKGGAKLCSPIFYYVKKIFLAKGGHGPMAP